MEPDVQPAPEEARPPRVPPWRQFDPDWYRAHYPQVHAELGEAATLWEIERYYWDVGCRLGHSPNMFFDELFYRRSYPDVAAHVDAGGMRSGFEHYCLDGYRRLSPHWLFDEGHYRAIYPDLSDEALASSGLLNGYHHYIEFGDAELRSGHRFFDPAYVRTATGAERPFRDVVARGEAAGSDQLLSWFFDPTWYLQTYPGVAQEVAAGRWSNALDHYTHNPTPTLFSPSRWFSEAFYAATYKDAADAVAAGVFRNGYAHFLSHGAAEARQPHPEVDLGRHAASRRVQAELARGDYPNLFVHWLARHDALDSEDAHPFDEIETKQHFVRMAGIGLSQFARRKLDFTVSGAPAVSVIMVLFNQFALTMSALASLRSSFHGGIELILVDSGSTDDTRRIGRFVEGARILRLPENEGFLQACNLALPHCTAPATLYLNNDLQLGTNAIAAALGRLASDARIAAVGGKIVRTNGMLQEAGCIVWRNGSTVGYLRDEDPDCPEANFVRDVDFCSGAFLMVRSEILRALGGFDEAFRPAYYEETDLCVRLRKNGYRIVYDPAVLIQHLEFGSSGQSSSEQMIRGNHARFVETHKDWLRYQYPASDRNLLLARSPQQRRGRILFLEDQLPLRDLGSGFVRSNDIVRTMSALDYHVTVYPLFLSDSLPLEVSANFPDDVEAIHDRGLAELRDFVRARSGYYDIVWIGRTHNLERLRPVLAACAGAFPAGGIVLDTEAVTAPRVIERARLLGWEQEDDLPAALAKEFAHAGLCRSVVAVSEADAELIRGVVSRPVHVLGHLQAARPTVRPFAERRGLLFLGAIHETGSPNHDSLAWFISEVLPLLAGRLPPEARFTVAGHVNARVDMAPFAAHPRVDLLGAVEEVGPLYEAHRLFVAPTRFAGGIPFKLHEAAAHGLPAVATTLLARQLGWADGVELLAAGADDPEGFADRIVTLHEEEAVWSALREAALQRIVDEHDQAGYAARLSAILDGAMRESLVNRRAS